MEMVQGMEGDRPIRNPRSHSLETHLRSSGDLISKLAVSATLVIIMAGMPLGNTAKRLVWLPRKLIHFPRISVYFYPFSPAIEYK